MPPLITKYRPDNWDDIVGNDATVKALSALLERDIEEVPHAFLITGPKGCGKTTIGRIIANELGCIGRDFKEVDSADFRGIDTIREIRSRLDYSCAEGDCKVILMDECHKLTDDAQTALLKALEEPPDHVFFILCTTHPDKLLPTIRSRCQAGTFEVSPLELEEMEGFLRTIVKKEKKKVPKEVITQIARDSMGACRDALGILDKIIDLDPEDMMEVAEQAAEKENQVIELCRALMQRAKWSQVAKIMKGLEKEDPEKTRLAVMGYCSTILLSGKEAAQAAIVMDEFREPLWNNGRPGLVMYAYFALQGMK